MAHFKKHKRHKRRYRDGWDTIRDYSRNSKEQRSRIDLRKPQFYDDYGKPKSFNG